MLNQVQVPVAYSMVSVAERLPDNNPINKFVNYWIAFNNIYVTLAQDAGQCPRLRINKDGTIRTSERAGIQMPTVITTSERTQIMIAVDSLQEECKQSLISHPSTAFFVYRVPEWRGRKIEFDGFNQRVNGVINVGRTADVCYPVWSPIEIDRYESYMKGDANADTVNRLAKQIADMLYTIRNNAMHGGKRPDYENDREVAAKALPLLKMIVSNFILIAP